MWHEVGEVQFHLGFFWRDSTWRRARRSFDRAIALEPETAALFSLRGAAWFDQGDSARAIADFDRAIERDPHDADTFVRRGLALDAQGDHDRAIADYDRAILLKPDDARTLYNRAIAWDEAAKAAPTP